MSENNKYFYAFCSVLDDAECKDWMKAVEEGSMSNEEVYQKLIEKHGDTTIANAHLSAAKAVEEQAKVHTAAPQSPQVPRPHVPTPQMPHASQTTMADKLKGLQEAKGNVKPSILDENRGHMPNPPSSIKNLCSTCVAPISIAILSTLESWHTNDKAKINALMDQIEKGETNIEDIFVTVLTEIPDSIESLNRVLGDLNLVLAAALQKAGEIRPDLAPMFQKERAELQGEEGA